MRGDFLCDALGWIDYLEEVEDPVFDIRQVHDQWREKKISNSSLITLM